MKKAPEAFRTISEAAEQLDLPQHVLRHWEDTFGHIRPMRRAGGRRYYRTYDIELIGGVKALLYDQRFTTKGVQKIFKENGAQYVADIGRRALAGEDIDLTTPSDETAVTPLAAAISADAAAQNPETIGALKRQLEQLLERLETVQDSLDEALLSVDTIVAMDEQ